MIIIAEERKRERKDNKVQNGRKEGSEQRIEELRNERVQRVIEGEGVEKQRNRENDGNVVDDG